MKQRNYGRGGDRHPLLLAMLCIAPAWATALLLAR